MPSKKQGSKRNGTIVVNLQHCCYPIIHNCVRERGWVVAKRGEAYDVAISDGNVMIKELIRMRSHPRTIVPVQRVNHFPDMRQLYTKTRLANNLRDVLAVMGDAAEHSIAPKTWSIPHDARALAQHVAYEASLKTSREDHGDSSMHCGDSTSDPKLATAASPRLPVYIIKPASGLQGRGIRLSDAPLEDPGVVSGRPLVVQQYIDNPMLLDGFKFDVRLYVLILSVDPLKIYLYNDGLVRLCTTLYTVPGSGEDHGMGARTAHLSNYTLNKRSANFAKGSNGSKRALKDVFATLKSRGVDVDLLWKGTIDVVNSAVLAVGPKLRSAYRAVIPKGSVLHSPSASTCFEILGVDVMWDTNLTSWLLEVNHMPSFRGGSRVDTRIKTGVVRQALEMLRVSLRRKRKLQARCRHEWERYMFEQAGCTPSRPRSSVARSSSSAPPTPSEYKPKSVDGLASSSSRTVSAAAAATVAEHVLGESEAALLIEMCNDDEQYAHRRPLSSTGDASGVADDSTESSCDEPSGHECMDTATSTATTTTTTRGDSETPSSDERKGVAEESDEDEETDDREASGAKGANEEEDVVDESDNAVVAPLPGSADEFVRIYSGLSRRCRSTYAAVIAAADVVFAMEPQQQPLKVPPPRASRYGRTSSSLRGGS